MSKLPSSSQLFCPPRASYVVGALLTALAAALLVSGATSTPTDFDPGKAPFVVLFGDEVVPYRIFGMPVMPGESYEVSAVAPDDRRFVLRASAGAPERRGETGGCGPLPRTRASTGWRSSTPSPPRRSP